MFTKNKLAITPLTAKTFLLSTNGELQLIINPSPKPEFMQSHQQLTEVVARSDAPIILSERIEDIEQTWNEKLIMYPGDQPRHNNTIPLQKDELFDITPNFTFSYPSYQENGTNTAFILVKALNIHLLYIASSVYVQNPPRLDVLLLPRNVLTRARNQTDNIHQLPLYLGCEPKLIIAQKTNKNHKLDIPSLHEVFPYHTIELIRHLSSIQILGIEPDLSEIFPILDFL